MTYCTKCYNLVVGIVMVIINLIAIFTIFIAILILGLLLGIGRCP
jgi:hypothetical protein